MSTCIRAHQGNVGGGGGCGWGSGGTTSSRSGGGGKSVTQTERDDLIGIGEGIKKEARVGIELTVLGLLLEREELILLGFESHRGMEKSRLYRASYHVRH